MKKKFEKLKKKTFKNDSYSLFFQENALIAQKSQLSIFFSSLVQMRWLNPFHIGKSIYHSIEILKFFF